ncbi:MAG TPA: OpgC domain-containing protein, partial [Hyphomicrobiaceae bacterium]|nr:OpgC domain-containing protein [Hyphomicrobiaceae bacterium]
MSTTKGRPSPGPASSGSHERSTAAASSRDYRIDFMRGIALIMIFINHIPGNVMGNFTSR